MDNFIVDREILAKIIDSLIEQKPLDLNSSEELDSFREKNIKKLNDRLMFAVFNKLSEEEIEEIERLMDENSSEETFMDYMKNHGIDVESVIEKTVIDFSSNFQKGEGYAQ
ncbi:hypothetical protein IKF34_02495 [Candidatus Saccharibacteria bacterium]|nr:hypothetical protein [Candidatus Saccharibacteria bacterium]